MTSPALLASKKKKAHGVSLRKSAIVSKDEILYYFGSYKHPFYDVLSKIKFDKYMYVSSREEERNAHVMKKASQVSSIVKQGVFLSIIKFFGIPKIMPLFPTQKWIHSAQYLLLTPKKYVVDFEDVSSFTWFDYKLLKNPITRFILQKSFSSSNCAAILPWTNAAKESLVNTLHLSDSVKKKIEIVYPAYVPNKLVSRANRSTVTLLFVGKLFYQKGGLETIQAYVNLRKKYPQLRLVVVSQVPQVVIDKYGKTPGIEFYGGIDTNALKKLYACADIFVMPGHYDTFGFVYLEAMSHGLPCIGTDNFATPEIISHNKTGLVIKNTFSRFDEKYRPVLNFLGNTTYLQTLQQIDDDYLLSLTAALERLIVNKKERLLFGKNSWAEIATGKFSVAQRTKKMNTIFSRVFE